MSHNGSHDAWQGIPHCLSQQNSVNDSTKNQTRRRGRQTMLRTMCTLATMLAFGCASSTNNSENQNTSGNAATGGMSATGTSQSAGGEANPGGQAEQGGAASGGQTAGGMDASDGESTANGSNSTGCSIPDMPEPTTEPSIDVRCPEAQSGEHLLVLYRDRVDAYRVRNFSLGDPCTFLDLAANGINAASGMVITQDDPARIFIAQPEDGCGGIYEFNLNGEYVKKVESNINLRGIAGLWNTFGDDLIAWSGASSNFYNVSADGKFAGSAKLPNSSNRIQGVTDLKYVDPDSLVMTFRDRPPQVFKDPFNPSLDMDEIGPANTVQTVQTDKGPQAIFRSSGCGRHAEWHRFVRRDCQWARAPQT